MARLIWLTCGVLVTMAALWTEAGGDKAKAVPVPPLAPPPISLVPKPISVDQAKLRQLITLPEGSYRSSFCCFDSRSLRVTAPARGKGTPQQIAASKERIAAHPDFAELYVELGDLLPEKKDWQMAYAKAVELFPKRLEADSKNGRLWVLYAQASLSMARTNEAETQALKAVEFAPDDWRGWQLLGNVQSKRSFELMTLAQCRKLTQAEQAKADRCKLGEEKCRDEAVRLAPTEPQVYGDRAEFHIFRAMTSRGPALGANAADEAPKTPEAQWLERQAVEKARKALRAAMIDVKQMVQLSPAVVDFQIFLANLAIIEGMANLAQEKPPAADASAFSDVARFFPNENQRIIRAVADRLLREAKSPAFSASWSAQLASLSLILGDKEAALLYANRAIELSPKSVGEELCLCLAEMFLQVAEAEAAERLLQATLNREPKYARVRLGLSSGQLAYSGDPADLAEARRGLDQALSELKCPRDRSHARLLQGVHLALSGQVGAAKAHFETMLKAEPENERVKAALAAFSK